MFESLSKEDVFAIGIRTGKKENVITTPTVLYRSGQSTPAPNGVYYACYNAETSSQSSTSTPTVSTSYMLLPFGYTPVILICAPIKGEVLKINYQINATGNTGTYGGNFTARLTNDISKCRLYGGSFQNNLANSMKVVEQKVFFSGKSVPDSEHTRHTVSINIGNLGYCYVLLSCSNVDVVIYDISVEQ